MRRAVLALCVFVAALSAQAQAEIAQKGNVRVSFDGEISPRVLPRSGSTPISISVGSTIATADGAQPPSLTRLQIAINRNGHLDSRGLPTCSFDDLQPSTTANALAACRSALVGEGSFNAAVAIPEQSPFPSQGKLLAFNGTEAGKPVIFAHVYGTEPIPTSFTLPMRISKAKGTYGTVLSAELPEVASSVAFVTGIALKLNRRFHYKGRVHGYVSAGCPAPEGFPGATFPLARASFAFAAAPTVTTVLNRSCRAKG
jgi:hypothetical protein